MPDLVGVEVTTQLTIYSRDGAGTRVPVDADSTPTASIEKDNVDWLDSDSVTVTHDDTGVYSFSWTPDTVAEYEVAWAFLVSGGEYSQTQSYSIEGSIVGVSETAADEEDAAPAVPDLGATKTCLVTGSFYDASGAAMKGVFVRFSPLRLEDAFLSLGVVAHDTTASSDENGQVQFYLLRGMKGTLTITGIGLVREVEVPDSGAIDLMALAALGDDLLEVQRPQFASLPRRS